METDTLFPDECCFGRAWSFSPARRSLGRCTAASRLSSTDPEILPDQPAIAALGEVFHARPSHQGRDRQRYPLQA